MGVLVDVRRRLLVGVVLATATLVMTQRFPVMSAVAAQEAPPVVDAKKGTSGSGDLATGALAAATTSITSAGPLTQIGVSADLNCTVNHTGDVSGSFYGDTSCATGLSWIFSVPAGAGTTKAERITVTHRDPLPNS